MVLQLPIPAWFHGWDILIDSVSVLAAFLVSLFSHRAYKFTEQKKYFVFFLAFFLIGLSFAIKIGTNVWLYNEIFVENAGRVTASELGDLLDIKVIGSFLYKLSMLLGLLAIFCLVNKIQERSLMALYVYLIVMLTFFSSFVSYVYPLTAALMLFLICQVYQCNAKRKKTNSANLVFFSFVLLFASQLFFIFHALKVEMYVIGESVQLLGFIGIITQYVLVWWHGNKKA